MVEQWRVFSKGEADRYQYHEFMLEVLTIFLDGKISHKRERLDHYMRSSVGAYEIAKAEKQVNKCFKWIRSILRDDGIRHTRFSKKADFYSLCGVLAELIGERAVTTNPKANRRARKQLTSLSIQIAKIGPKVVRYSIGRSVHVGKQLGAYIVATREGTDQLANRERRHALLKNILFPIFRKRLSRNRLFGRDLKNALWLGKMPRRGRIACPNPDGLWDCLGRMTFEQCEVDHKKAHSSGGPTDYPNAQLLCKICNAHKGNR
jgi:hypothetical protein